MTFQPVIPFGGNGGWAFLSRTREAQQAAFDASPAVQRNTAYFEQTIAKITSAEELVADRRLLEVALGAFGLEGDIGNKFFIRKVLEDGTFDPDSLANRLSDKRYLEMSKAFGFGDVSPPNTVLSDFAPRIVAAFREKQFEAAVGEQAPDMRLALGLERDLGQLASGGMSDEAMWFTVMATPPLRTVFERAFSLPVAVGTLDIDRQLEIFREKAGALFGDTRLAQFADPEKIDALRDTFLGRSELLSGPPATVRGSAALALLQASNPFGRTLV